MKVSKHFDIREFVSEITWIGYKEQSVWFIDERIVLASEWLRSFVGKPLMINTWHNGGSRHESGFRLPSCVTGAKMSQHRFGRAIDIVSQDYSADELRQIVRENFIILRTNFGISAIETGVSWLHMDCRATIKPELMEFKP